MKPAHVKKSSSSLLTRLRRLVFGRIRVRVDFGDPTRFQESTAVAPPAAATSAPTDVAAAAPARKKPRAVLKRRFAPLAPETALESEFRQMHHELSIFLNGAKNRKALRHLAFFEGVLHKRGPQALESVSLDTLKKAHAQLNLLLNVAPSRILRVLASKMLVALVARENEGAVHILDTRSTDFVPSRSF